MTRFLWTGCLCPLAACAEPAVDVVGTQFVDERVQVDGVDVPGLAYDVVDIVARVDDMVLVELWTDDECAILHAFLDVSVSPPRSSGPFETGSSMSAWKADGPWIEAPACVPGVGPVKEIVRHSWDGTKVRRE